MFLFFKDAPESAGVDVKGEPHWVPWPNIVVFQRHSTDGFARRLLEEGKH